MISSTEKPACSARSRSFKSFTSNASSTAHANGMLHKWKYKYSCETSSTDVCKRNKLLTYCYCLPFYVRKIILFSLFVRVGSKHFTQITRTWNHNTKLRKIVLLTHISYLQKSTTLEWYSIQHMSDKSTTLCGTNHHRYLYTWDSPASRNSLSLWTGVCPSCLSCCTSGRK